MNDELEGLTERYCEAAVALTEYRRSHGFNPGVRVVAKYRDDPDKNGTIAPFGPAWHGTHGMFVPVLLDSGVLQPWDMRHLTIIPPSP